MDVTGIGAADNAMLAPVTKAFSFGMRLILGMQENYIMLKTETIGIRFEISRKYLKTENKHKKMFPLNAEGRADCFS